MSSRQIDNSYLQEKIKLRVNSLNEIKKKDIFVFEAFCGDGVIWDEVKKRTNKNIKILKVDKKANKSGLYLKGDNLKFLSSIDLTKFDIIDLDAYGSPYRQLAEIFKREYKGIVHLTFIQSMLGGVNHDLLVELGYSKKMIKKCPTLFSKNGLNKILSYLSKHDIKKTTGVFVNNKNYFYFKTN